MTAKNVIVIIVNVIEKSMTIDNIDIQTYFTMEDSTSYDILIEPINPKNEFKGKKANLNKLTFDEVEYIKGVFLKPNFEKIMDVICHCYNIRGSFEESKKKQYLSTSIFDLFRAQKYIQEFIKEIIRKEIMWLNNDNDYKLRVIDAAQRLKSFSHLLTKIRLAEQFSTTPTEIGLWEYSKIFTILCANTTFQDLQKEYNEIK